VCRHCFNDKDKLFGPENVEIQVKKSLRFDPLLGIYEYVFDWSGTKAMINGKVGTIQYTNLGSCNMIFPDDEKRWGTQVSTLDYWRLLEIYKATGGETEPPPLDFPPYTPKKVDLLDEPILPITVEMVDGNIRLIQIGSQSIACGLMFAPTELPNIRTLHAFTNLYVRYKFGLAPYPCAEGGFIGDDFEVRNAGGIIGGVGLSVHMHPIINELKYVNSPEELYQLALKEGLIGLIAEHERRRPGVIKGASAHEILSTWINVMRTLLSYDWRKIAFRTVNDIWQHYCRMQDVLLNIVPADELTEALVYVRENKMHGCGCSY